MGDLSGDTQVQGSDGSYVAEVSPEWDFWTPNGGYLSALALRAAASETDLAQPAAYYCHYLNPGVSGQAADIRVTTLRRSSRTHALRVELNQGERNILEALVWMITPPGGVNYDHSAMPEVPSPGELRSNEEIHAPDSAPFPFWNNIEGRPVTWTGRWEEHPEMHPLWRTWSRFRPQATFDDPFVDAARALVLLDTMFYPAAALPHTGPFPFMAPSIDLAVRFHRPAPDSEWLLTSTESPIGVEGLLGGYAALWAEDGRLIATGGQQMLARELPTS